MAVLIARADGNWTSSSTWGLVSATGYQNVHTNNTALTTSYVASAAFAPGAIEIDGIAVKLASRNASPTGTISVELYNSTGAASVKEVTVNVSDLPLCTTSDLTGGWFFFKFDVPVTLSAATNYQVRAKTSSTSQVNLYRSGTAGDWSRALRTTTQQAPAAGDDVIITAEWTAATTKTDRTVTMDVTSLATDYGSNSTGTQNAAIFICNGGKLTWPTTAASTYQIKVSGNVQVYRGGVLHIGTQGAEIPRDSVAILEIDCGTDNAFSIYGRIGSIVHAYGLSRTSGKNITHCLLSADAAATATSLSVDTDTGWLSGDEIAISPTGTNYLHGEVRTLSGNAGASSMSVTAGLTNAHLGTAPTKAIVGLLTRNVTIRASTVGLATSLDLRAEFKFSWVAFRYTGGSSPRGIEPEGDETKLIEYCSIYEYESHAIYLVSSISNLTINQTVFYTTVGSQSIFATTSLTLTSVSITNNAVISNRNSAAAGIDLSSDVTTLTGNKVAGCGYGFELGGGIVYAATLTDNEANTCYRSGLYLNANVRSTAFSNWKLWRNGWGVSSIGSNIYLSGDVRDITFTDFEIFGSPNCSIYITSSIAMAKFYNLIASGDSGAACQHFVRFTTTSIFSDLLFEDCDLNANTGIKTEHVQFMFLFEGSATCSKIFAKNCAIGSTPAQSGFGNYIDDSYIRFEDSDDTARHRIIYPFGEVKRNTSVFNTAAPSIEMVPSSASKKLRSGYVRAAVNNGESKSLSVYVRKSAAYNGAQPRFMVRRKGALGIAEDTVLDTMSVGADTWEQLSGLTDSVYADGVLEFYVDCDGTAGSVYVDDVAA